MIRRIRDSHSFTLNAPMCIHVSHVSSSYSVLKVPVSSPAIYRAPKTALNALYYKPVPAFDCWAPSRSSLSGPPANCQTGLFFFKVLSTPGTKKAGLLPAPYSQGACNLPQLYLDVATHAVLTQTLVLAAVAVVEMRRLELLASAVQRRRSPN